jgi:hypothetical protein
MRKPKATAQWINDECIVTCSECDHSAELDEYDVGGADEGCLFCNHCGAEVEVIDYPQRTPAE